MKATLLFEDGTLFSGENFGFAGEVCGEMVFYTGVVGYQEVLTDPAYRGKIVLMTYPLIGNYGVNPAGMESSSAQASALVVKEISRMYSNWLSTGSLEEFMQQQKVLGLKGIDTRAAAIHIRDHGEGKAILSTAEHDTKKLAAKLAAYKENDLVAGATCKKTSDWLPSQSKGKLAVLDLGSSRSLNDLLSQNFQIKLFPAKTKAEVLLAEKAEGVFISSGPGSPESIPDVVDEVKKLIDKVPLSGAGLGHHVLGTALGAKVKKMKAGHHGGNHPVRCLESGRDEITVQNHSYTLDPASVKSCGAQIWEVNVNDDTVESMRSQKHKIFSTEYFPLSLDEFKKVMK